MSADDIAATCLGVRVPASEFLDPGQIRRINRAKYEGQEIAGALHVVGAGDRVLEVGAGLGIVGAVVAHNRAPERMLSFEANPALLPHIRRLYRLNGLEAAAEARNAVLIAAPDRPETVPFHIHPSFRSSSLIAAEDSAPPIDVPTADFAEVCAELRPTVLISDIEGGELELLRHADLSGFRAMVIEFHGRAYGAAGRRECQALLRAAGLAPVPEHSTQRVWTCLRQSGAAGLRRRAARALRRLAERHGG